MTIPREAAAAVFLSLIVAGAHGLGSPATLAVIQSSGAVCGVLAGGRIRCAVVGQPAALAVSPKLSFESISGGRDFFCGLRSGGLSIFCWTITNFSGGLVSTKRIHNGSFVLADLSVGEDQVCALEKNRSRVLCWRGGSSFPARIDGEYRSLTSGGGFSCGIGNESRVECWGGRGFDIQNAFGDVSMQSIVAGDSHVCGIDLSGVLVCKGSDGSGQSNAPLGGAFEFSGLALGLNHSCAIKQPNGTVLCWGGGAAAGASSYSPENLTDFEFIVAGGDLTCGVIAENFTVVCWKADLINHPSFALPLPPILPGRCVADASSCKCGVFPDSESLCLDSGAICNSCGPPFTPQPPPPAAAAAAAAKTRKGWLAFGIIGFAGGLAAVCSILCLIWSVARRNKKVHNSTTKQPPIPSIATNSSFPTLKERAEDFAFAELAAATNNFSLDCRIGIGSFGAVYKGKLSDNREVAIKRGDFRSSQKNSNFQEKERAFQSELHFLSRLHHKHLVDLVGYCDERVDERLLVYDYMKNGALHDHLHSAANKTGKMNSWRMRIKVLLDAGRGIEYLHNYAVPPIIHRDIKSSNILLDGEWVARVSDFGLSAAEAHVAEGAAGTMGYIDPEYYGGMQRQTTKSDVYGFGVVMLEMLTGRRAIFMGEGGEAVSLVEYAAGRIEEGEMGGVLDGRMRWPEMREGEAVELVAYTAVRCVCAEGKDRPNITDVVMNLEGALALCDEREESWSSSNVSFSSRD